MDSPVCSSSYNGKRLTSLSSSNSLCSKWTISSFTYSDSTHKWTWKCNNTAWESVSCSATWPYCGDGIKDSWETCDPKDTTNKSWWWNGGCSDTCTAITVDSPVCSSSYNEKRLTSLSSSNSLCSKWTISDFTYSDSTHKWTWKCNNTLWEKVDCSATKPYCGDGVRDADESCDYKDTSKLWWWNGWCDNSCEPIIESEWCDESFYNTLRYGRQYTFYDDFHANSSDKWLWNWNMEYQEQYDYNKSSDFPQFGWTTQLINNNYKVAKNTTMRVLEASSKYPILAVPASRSYDNLFIKYTLTYSTDEAWKNKYWHSECAYYEISRCGDGVLDIAWPSDQRESETCDPADPNHTNWWNGWCNSSCEPITVVWPVCNSDYHWQRTGDLINWSYLCREWDVSEFKYDEGTHKWTWKCSNVAWEEDCRAIKPYCGDGVLDEWETCDPADPNHTNWWSDGCSLTCEPKYLAGEPVIEKTLQDPIPVEYTGQVLKWTVKVTAKWWDVTDFQIQDRLPEALDYVSYKVVSNADNLTVTWPVWPVKSWSNNIYTWNVKWTLKENHVLTLEVETKVNKMPKSDDDYLNIACVIDDGKIDCDEDEPPVKNGEPVIEKTLQEKVPVEYTGQTLKWTVKVTAKWWDVTDFQIQDRLPEALDYVSYKVVSNADKLTVTWPTWPVKSGSNNIYTWDVKWTLKESHTLTLEVETKVNKMPKSDDDYLNIACVIDDGKIDCDEDEPPVKNGEPVIEKTLQEKVPVEYTGQTLKWTVKVTAKWWDVTDFQIQDRLPEALDYVSYKVVSNADKLTVTWPTWPVKSGSNNIYTWDVKWTLKESHTLTLEVETKVNKMPKSDDDYLNIACVIDDGKEISCGEDEPPVTKWELEILKTLVSKDKYVTHTWQELEWKITVTAKNWDVEMEYIKDKLPDVLDYSGYKKWSVPSWITINKPTLSSDKKEITWKVTWTLMSGNSIELHVYTTVNKMPEKIVENVACAKPQDWDEECKPWHTYDLWIEKFVWNKQNNKRDKAMTWKVWETITYQIRFWNNGNESVRVKIKDYLPKWVRFISGTLIVWKQTTEWWVGTWTFDMVYNGTEYKIDGVTINSYESIFLNGKEQWILTIEGEILNDTKNTTNFVCIFDENSDNKEPIACDDAHHNITDEVMCKKLDITTRSFGNGWWSTNVSCSTDWWQAELIELDCGNGTIITWANISVLPWTCSYPSNSSSSSKSYSVQCKVDWKTTSDCKWTVSVQWQWWNGWSDPYCTKPTLTWSDRVKTVVCETDNGRSWEIKIDCGYWNQVYTSDWKVKSFTWTCDYTNAGYGTYKIRCRVDNRDIRESECSSEVKYTQPWWPSWGWCSDCGERINKILSPMKCFNINAWNISVEEWEILPFYWNIEKLDEKTVEDLRYVEWGNKNYWDQMYDKLLGQSCDRFGDIALNSMICYASVVDWYNNAIVKDKRFACLDAKWAKKDKVINAWINWQSCKYNGCQLMQSYDPVDGTDYTFRSNAQIIEKLWVDVTNLNLWEYYVSLDRVEYLYCDWEKRTEWKSVNTTCRSNFVLTSPYTVQKTPSWNLKASTQTLSRFKPQAWGKIFSEYINAISTSSYSKNTAVEDAMDKFIKKYEKLAVKVDTTKFWKDVEVKKVPWKDIYFLEWDAEFSSNGAKIDKPFTIVQTKWSTTIDGDLQYNMMLLTKNNITFKWNCTSDQAVKWIFYAWWKLYRAWANDKEGIEKNKSKDNTYWCDAWWLHIKWVLIWDNFDNLMKSSRSHIDGWWKSDGESRYWENDLRTKVMDGASVLIEYSPSVFTKSTMPPGAEDFTTALSIYKQ